MAGLKKFIHWFLISISMKLFKTAFSEVLPKSNMDYDYRSRLGYTFKLLALIDDETPSMNSKNSIHMNHVFDMASLSFRHKPK